MIENISHLFPALNPDGETPENNYRVAFRGKLLDEQSPSDVAARLKNDVGMSNQQVEAFLSGRKFFVSKNLPRAKAARIRGMLRKAGLDVVANSAPREQEISLPELTEAPAPAEDYETESTIAPSKDKSRWVIIGGTSVFTVAVIWMFFALSPALKTPPETSSTQLTTYEESIPETVTQTTTATSAKALDDSLELVFPGKTIQSQDGNFQVSAPDNWAVLENLHDNAALQIGDLATEVYFIVARELKERVPDADFRAYSERAKQNFPRESISRQLEIEVNHRPAFQFQSHGTVEDIDVSYLMTTLEGASHYYQLLAWGLYSQQAENIPIFNGIIQSFKEH